MKTGWKIRPLGELCRIELGSTPARDNPAMWDDTRETNNVWLSIADLPQQLHAVARDSKEYVSNRAAETMKLVPTGTLLVSFKLTLGRLGYAGRELFTNEAIAALLDLNSAELDKEYLYWYLTFFDWNQAAEGDQKIKGKTLNKAKLKLLPVCLPPLEEQQRIVAILDEVFEGLSRARANTEANMQSVRELFDNSLIRVFDEIEDKAARMTLTEASTSFGRGRSRHRPRNAPILYGGIYPFVQTGDIRNSDGTVLEYSQTYNALGLAQSKLWPKGTICITIAANIAETAVLGFDACFPDSIIGMVVDPRITFPEYVEYMLRYFAADLKALGKGSAQDNINLATFEKATFPFPPLDKQRQIIEILSELSMRTAKLSEAYRAQIGSLGALRQSVLRKAFAGELT